ncbi:Uncharacterized protein HZ326_28076 [Fusarium oxysporum f. sp. albedinis]|nr:Uncharacterized protein HZ326_28076 [Fusarium oxysporum f. sp. albedinis]
MSELKRVEHESNYVISDATRCGNLFPTTKRASVALYVVGVMPCDPDAYIYTSWKGSNTLLNRAGGDKDGCVADIELFEE